MRILILTVSAGEGHNSISRALIATIGDRAEVMNYDIYKDKSRFHSWLIHKGYFFGCKYFMPVMNWWYERQKRRDPNKTDHTVMHSITKKAKKQVLALMDEFAPDVVMCTHMYCAHIVGEFKRQGLTKAKVICVLSDYDVPPYMELCTGVDYMVTPSEDFNAELVRRGYTIDQILPYGIPTDVRFSVQENKQEMREKLGLDKDKFTVLMMNGGMGFGNMAKVVKAVATAKSDFQIISVCGHNGKLKRKVDKFLARGTVDKKVLNLGFVNNVHELMSASDVLVGKSGGLSSTEAFNKFLPIVVTSGLPWQEYDNMLYFKRNGVCDYVDKERNVGKTLEKLITESGTYEARVRSVTEFRRPDAINRIVDKIME